MANTTLRYHWLIRKLTRNKFSIEERTDMYLKATEAASLGWLINFVSSARGDYQVREDRQPTAEEDCLVSENVLPELTKRALNAIRTSSADGSLLVHKDLLYILYRWIDFMGGDPTEARAWTDSLLDDRKALLILVKVMTGASWSMGMGGFGSLGDRVSKRTVRAQISDDSPVIDARKFRAAIEKIANDKTHQMMKLRPSRLSCPHGIIALGEKIELKSRPRDEVLVGHPIIGINCHSLLEPARG